MSRWLSSLSGPPVDGPKDPWPRVLSLPERFVGDPVSLARDNIKGVGVAQVKHEKLDGLTFDFVPKAGNTGTY